MLDLFESFMVDEAEQQLLFSQEEMGGREAARSQVRQSLYAAYAQSVDRDELAKTWGLQPEHQAGLAAAVAVTGGIRNQEG